MADVKRQYVVETEMDDGLNERKFRDVRDLHEEAMEVIHARMIDEARSSPSSRPRSRTCRALLYEQDFISGDLVSMRLVMIASVSVTLVEG